MNITTERQITLEDFLKLPETKPASEFINGEILRKVMPQGEHWTVSATRPRFHNISEYRAGLHWLQLGVVTHQ